MLAGAKTVMGNSKYDGRLPDDPVILEKEIDGVGRYTAGVLLIIRHSHDLTIHKGPSVRWLMERGPLSYVALFHPMTCADK